MIPTSCLFLFLIFVPQNNAKQHCATLYDNGDFTDDDFLEVAEESNFVISNSRDDLEEQTSAVAVEKLCKFTGYNNHGEILIAIGPVCSGDRNKTKLDERANNAITKVDCECFNEDTNCLESAKHVTDQQLPETNPLYYIIPAVALVCLLGIVVTVVIKVNKLKVVKNEEVVDMNPDYGCEDIEYHDGTSNSVTDTNEYYEI